jgi:A/G-specific adenine glycosylase
MPATLALSARLLRWYDHHRRALPWRAAKGSPADPYRVWLSEIMLQQTTVAAVAPYYARFLERFPSVTALADASQDDVLALWAGLGYYARARNLHACARKIVAEHRGRFPEDEAELRKLPGIGRYTAAAIAAIAFNKQAAPVDGNIERVLARAFGVTEPLPAAKKRLAGVAESLVPARRPGDFAQALMDLGATICTPKRPRCMLCPWREPCVARANGLAEALPRRANKREKPLRRGIAFLLERADGAVLLRKRADKGLLGGLWELPSTPWDENAPSPAQALKLAPLNAKWRALPGRVRHSFTHFDLEIEVWRARTKDGASAEGRFVSPGDLHTIALSNLMKKALAHARAGRIDFEDAKSIADQGVARGEGGGRCRSRSLNGTG